MYEFIDFLLIGFFAQLIDGSLGMAYGLISTTLLLSLGIPPALASATTHAAECATTGFSAIAHHQFGNIDKRLFRQLLLPGMIGAVAGAILLTNIEGNTIKPLIGLYLFLMGLIVLIKLFREFPPYRVTEHLIPLGLFGGFFDVLGGGGWGSIVTSTLLARGNDARTTIGTVNACEFFIALTATFAFLLSGAFVRWDTILALAIGGALAAPLGAWFCKHLPAKWLMLFVGVLIIILSIRVIWISL